LVLKQVWTSSGCGLEGFVTEAEKWRYGKVGFRAGFVTEGTSGVWSGETWICDGERNLKVWSVL